MRLFWTPPGGQEAPIPATAYSHLPPLPSPIEVRGDEQRRLNLQLPDGGLRPVVGVQNIQVLRASRGKPDAADQRRLDLRPPPGSGGVEGPALCRLGHDAEGRGRSSLQGRLCDLHGRISLVRACRSLPAPGRLGLPFLLLPRRQRPDAGVLRRQVAGGTVSEAAKKVLLVREITADHRLGEVFTLITPLPDQPPSFEAATDAGFVAACREAAGNNLLLEQQDYGVLSRRPPHEVA